MEIVRRVHSMKEICRQARGNGRTIGFVPTMGALHAGHVSLIRRVKELADVVIVSIFVNPTQFAPDEDFDRYPRDLTADTDVCIAEEVDYVFAPNVDELYPEHSQTFVEVTDLSMRLEGAQRPGHFRGVTTVVCKLFHVILPTVAALGQKDAQQATIVQRMVRDLMMDVEILVLPVMRDEDGVALSSRNVRLDETQRQAARAIPRALNAARQALDQGQRSPEKLLDEARETLAAEVALELEYLELVDSERFEPVEQLDGEMYLLVAVRAGEIRLIDNVLLKV